MIIIGSTRGTVHQNVDFSFYACKLICVLNFPTTDTIVRGASLRSLNSNYVALMYAYIYVNIELGR